MLRHLGCRTLPYLVLAGAVGCGHSPDAVVAYHQGAVSHYGSVSFGHREQMGDAEFIHQVFPDALRRFPNLKRLVMDGTEIGDPSLPLIAQLRTLEIVSVYDTKVSGKGLKALAALPRLQRLEIPISVTDEELSELQTAMPQVQLIRAKRGRDYPDWEAAVPHSGHRAGVARRS